MKRHVLILAGGDGTRAGGDMPKQFQQLLGIPMLWWSVRAFHHQDPDAEIAIVMHPGFFDYWDIIRAEMNNADRAIPVRLVCGGINRMASVRNGLMQIPSTPEDFVAVHDAARPIVSEELIAELWEAAEFSGAAIPCCKESNSLRKIEKPDFTIPIDRSDILTVQTPQTFRSDWLKEAHERFANSGSFTDDASMVQECGHQVRIVNGDPANIKVTNPVDFIIADALLRHRMAGK